MKLMRKQKNEFFDRIIDAGLEPKEFTLSTESLQWADYFVFDKADEQAFSVIHKETGYQFVCGQKDKSRYVGYSPNANHERSGSESQVFSTNAEAWNWLMDRFEFWLKNLSEEISQPDKWEKLLQQDGIFGNSNDDVKTEFTEEEIGNIDRYVNGLAIEVHALDALSAGERESIVSRLDSLVEEARHSTKIRWKELFVSTMLQILAELMVAHGQAVAQIFYELTKASFGTVGMSLLK
jgi:hypothetical protein